MQKIVIQQLGPIKYCELQVDELIVFTGPQASGKSTVAKSVFFFKNIKNLLVTQIQRRCLYSTASGENTIKLNLKRKMLKEIRANFLQTFGSTWGMSKDMQVKYYYSDECFIEVLLVDDPNSPNYIWIEFSDSLVKYLNEWDKRITADSVGSVDEMRLDVQRFFGDDQEVIYIPAGRSMITLLSDQLTYIYSAMDDLQKKNIDYCTQNYLERILQLKPFFSKSPKQLLTEQRYLSDLRLDHKYLNQVVAIMNQILKGEYCCKSGEERLLVANKYVKINFASSGQQEVVWILNVIYYYLLNNKKAYFIIEEPESHLFPNAQKLISELISMARKDGENGVFITTHSPYILGTFNNMLYADKIATMVKKQQLSEVIPEVCWIPFAKMKAYYVEDGKATSCMDDEFGQIENEIIDGASEHINNDYDKMVALKGEREC